MLERLAAILLVLVSLVGPVRPSTAACVDLCARACCGNESSCPCCVESEPESRQDVPPQSPVRDVVKLVVVLPMTEAVVEPAPRETRVWNSHGREAPRFVGESVQAALCVWRT